MVRNVWLFGPLGKKYGRQHRLDVRTTGEAMRALDANYPGFMAEVQRLSDMGYAYRVTSGKPGTKTQAGELKDLLVPVSGDIRVTPVVGGAKKGGLGQLVVGAVIAVAAFYTGGAAAAMAAASAGGATAGAALTAGLGALSGLSAVAFNIGVSLAIGGVAQMLTPSPSLGNSVSADQNKSDVFNSSGAMNLMAQGNPVPIGYGEVFAGSCVISAGISTEAVPV